jgi:D-sedoheptulose 7-phosphate isomerase
MGKDVKYMNNSNKYSADKILETLITEYKKLELCKLNIWDAFLLLRDCYSSGGKLLICCNGGSAADSEHIVGELMKGFLLKRFLKEEECDKIKSNFPDEWEYLSRGLQRALPAISLVSHTSLSSAYANDINSDMVFAQQVYGYGKEGDVLLGISTSGNSKNIVNALKVAKAFGLKTIGLTGGEGGKMKELCDVSIIAPAAETHKVQEYHLPIYHTLCAMLEVEFFN